MSPSSLRALLLALALAIQTIAGGVGVARATSAELALKAHCAAMTGQSEGAADSRQDGRHQHCDSCFLCAGPPAVSLAAFSSFPIAPRAMRVAGHIANETGRIPSRLAQSRFARGPPPGFDRA
ncbi:hypothetical protein WOC76_15600 [Methylocystis sp. IM3]|jgi:hypothetical protein|uniref:hypothetical protein n=1 Tax=unclassified Methylocystis TaxID=2625913 RepID=UPI0030FB94B0